MCVFCQDNRRSVLFLAHVVDIQTRIIDAMLNHDEVSYKRLFIELSECAEHSREQLNAECCKRNAS